MMQQIMNHRRVAGFRILRSVISLGGTFCLLPSAFCLYAAEIHLRGECNASGLVRLGDVAEIHANDAGEATHLKEIELFPAPPVGGKSFVRAREVQDLLALRGVNLSQHRLTGSSQIEIRNGAKPAAPLAAGVARRAIDRVEAAIASHLQREAGKDTDWEIEAHLDDEQARMIAAMKESIAAGGGKAPWTGDQQFTITVPGTPGVPLLTVATTVAAVPQVVVAKRAIVPGDIVNSTDVKLGRAKTSDNDLPFHSLEEVIGKETKRAIVEGQSIKQGDLRSPLLVRRGDAVHVYARSAGIQVHVQGRAQDDGSRGDLIVVESINSNRERFMARVSGIREVEVFAQAADAEAAAPTASTETRPMKAARVKTLADRRVTGFRLPSQTTATADGRQAPTVQR
jgi:flagella basal body P-ring formation protein FlgA